MKQMKELHESVNFEKLIYHYKGENADVSHVK